jgi:hypothetical protein
MNLINLSGKTIKVYSPMSCRYGHKGRIELINNMEQPILELPSVGHLVPQSEVDEEFVNGVPVIVQNYYSVDNPALYLDSSASPENTGIVVSNLYASVARSLGVLDIKMYTLYKLVHRASEGGNSRPEVVGCLGFESK